MTATIPNERQLRTILRRGVADIIVEEEFVRLLKSGKPLRLKMGFDPSAPDIHLGHTVAMRKLRQLQDLGHQVVIIVGDWTAQIGDPSGRSATRPMLTAEQVRANAESYLAQFFKVVDRQRTEVRRQTEWFGNFGLADVIRLTSRFTVAQLLRREDFAKRFEEDKPIAVTELLYPLLQAYDSVMVRADVEFGGTDQRFNNLLGRELQQMMGQSPQEVFLVPILVGTDGAQKMSKSLGNYIGVAEPSEEMFGKCMSISDAMIVPYFELLTDVPDDEIEAMRGQVESHGVNPMEMKKRLGRALVTQFHSAEAAAEAQAHFERVVQRKEAPEDEQIQSVEFSFLNPGRGENADVVVRGIDSDTIEVNIAKLVAKKRLVPSASEARRLLQQGAIRVDGRQLGAGEVAVRVKHDTLIRVGGRRYLRVEDKDRPL